MIIKNSNLRRNLFNNKYNLLGFIIAIILVLFAVKILNNMVKQENTTTNNIAINSTYHPEETIIAGQNVSTKKQETNEEVINKFITFCNNSQINEAYNLLTEECKENVFDNSIERFKNEYIEKNFTSEKKYSMQSWMNSLDATTYKISFYEDMLATGKTGEITIQYYTVVNQEGTEKLNINGYVGRTQINQEKTVNNITLTILYKDVYMDYVTYRIKAQNNTNNTILLDSKENSKSVYITGNNEVTYRAFMYEIDDVFLTIKPRIYRNFDIKFNKIYSPNIPEEKITFSDIINNVEEYKKLEDKQLYVDRTKIDIEL